MTVSAGTLLRCDLDGVERDGHALNSAAAALDDIVRRIPATPPSWSGFAADSAADHAATLQVQLRRVSDGVHQCGDVLRAVVVGLRPAVAALHRARLATDAALSDVSADAVIADAAMLTNAALDAADEVITDAAGALRRAMSTLAAGAAPHEPSAPPDDIWLPARVPTTSSEIAVAAWWSAMPVAARVTLLHRSPAVLGRLDGLPMQVRHDANRAVLDQERADLDRRSTGAGLVNPFGLLRVARRRRLLAVVQRELAADPSRRLVTLDVAGGLAGIALGDVDTARHVAVLVPGLGIEVTGDLGSLVSDAGHVRAAAEHVARSALQGGAAETVATIAWLGYRTPDLATVGSSRRARTGGGLLAGFTDGLDSSRRMQMLGRPTGSAVHLSLIGHSYGSLAVGHALRRAAAAGDVILVGSPGVASGTAHQLRPGRTGTVYVVEAAGDPVADLSWFGSDPSKPAFGAIPLQTDGGIDPVTGQRLRASHGHSDYFTVGTESVRNIGAVVAGRPSVASRGDMSGFGDRLLDGFGPIHR